MKTNAKVLKQHHRKLRELADEGVQEGHIGEEDGQNMLPKEPKAARFLHELLRPETNSAINRTATMAGSGQWFREQHRRGK